MLTQRVTSVDLERGRIRLPHDTKRLFPPTRGLVDIILRGTPIKVNYDPRLGPDRERSAVLGVGRAVLGTLVERDQVLEVRSLPDGSVELT
jgi:hypothetical protein